MCNHNQRMEETHVSTEPPEIGLENGIFCSFSALIAKHIASPVLNPKLRSYLETT